MHPILVDFGTYDLPFVGATHLFLPTYGLLFAVGALVAWSWFHRRALSIGLEAEAAFNLAFYSLLAGLFGAKLVLILIDWRYYLANPGEILGSLRSAGVLMGGVIIAAAAFIAYSLRHDLPLHRLGDAVAAPLALAQGIGRLGCFAAGCCWGKPSGAWCAVTFRDPAAQAQTGVPLGVPLLPTQIIESGVDLGLAGLLTVLWRLKPRPDGTVFYVYMLLYGLARGTIEFWRGDAARGFWFDGRVSTSQALSLAVVAIAAFFLIQGRLRSRRRGSA